MVEANPHGGGERASVEADSRETRPHPVLAPRGDGVDIGRVVEQGNPTEECGGLPAELDIGGQMSLYDHDPGDVDEAPPLPGRRHTPQEFGGEVRTACDGDVLVAVTRGVGQRTRGR